MRGLLLWYVALTLLLFLAARVFFVGFASRQYRVNHG